MYVVKKKHFLSNSEAFASELPDVSWLLRVECGTWTHDRIEFIVKIQIL